MNGDESLFFEKLCGRYFWKREIDVILAEYHLNRNFILRGECSLNEFYDFLGLPQTKQGSRLGWSVYSGQAFYGYCWIDFSHKKINSYDPDQPPYYEIIMPFPPQEGYWEDIEC